MYRVFLSFRENRCSEIQIPLTGVNEFHLLSDFVEFQYKRCTHNSGEYLHIF